MNAVGYPLYLNGKLVPATARLVHAPTAAGSYYIGPPPVGEYNLNPNAPGMGAYVQYPVRGLGQAGIGAATVMLGAIVLGVAGWYAGKAMSPTRSSEGSYKLAGAVANVVLPGLGLGLVGGFALANKSGRASVGV